MRPSTSTATCGLFGPASSPSLNVSSAGAGSSLGLFVTDGGELGRDLSVIVIPDVTPQLLYSIRFDSPSGSSIAWTYTPPGGSGKKMFAALGPKAVYVSCGTTYIALNKFTGELLWNATFTTLDHRLGARMLGYGPATRLLGYGPTPSVGALARKLQVSQTKTSTRSATMTKSATASFNPVVNSVTCGYETLNFPPLITSAGLLLQPTLRCVVGINSTTGRLAWYRITGSGPNYNINIGEYGTVTLTAPLVLSEDEAIFCGGTSSGLVFCGQTVDGSLIWKRKITAQAGGLVCTPLIHNSTLFLQAKSDADTTGRGTLFVFAYTLSGVHLWNISMTSASNAPDSGIMSVLPGFAPGAADALVLTSQLAASTAIFVVDPVRATLLRTILLPSSYGGPTSAVAVDAMNALFMVILSALDFEHSLYRVNATTGTTTYGLIVGLTAAQITSPSYLSVLVGSGALLLSDVNGGVYVYR